MKQYYESEVLFQLMEREGLNIPSSVPPYEAEIKAYLINQVKQAYPKLTDYEAEWLLYNYTKHLPAEFPISSVSDVTEATFENVVPFVYQSATLKGSTKYRDIDTGDILDTFDETKNLELVSVKMPVLSTTGKNLFHIEGKEVYSENNLHQIQNDEVIMENTTYGYYNCSIKYFNLKPNGIYAISYDSEILSGTPFDAVRVLDEQKNTLNSDNGTFTAPLNGKVQIRFYSGSNNNIGKIRYYNIQIEEGSTATTYEPYKSNILTVNEDVTLCGIGGVKDELNLLTCELTQRIGEIVLDGSENWFRGNQDNEFTTLFAVRDIVRFDDVNTNFPAISDRFAYNKNLYGKENVTEGFFTGWSGFYVRIGRDKVSPNVEDFKQWLSQNPTTFQYELKTPVIKTVDLTTVNENGESDYFMPIEGTMSVQSSGENIKPTFDMSVPVEATTQNLASFIDLEMRE